MGWHIQKEQDEKCPLAKNQPANADLWRDLSTVCCDDSILILLN